MNAKPDVMTETPNPDASRPTGMCGSTSKCEWCPSDFICYVKAGKELEIIRARECLSCGEKMPKGECPKALRKCGHHCNHSWEQDKCCWCGTEFGEIDPVVGDAPVPEKEGER